MWGLAVYSQRSGMLVYGGNGEDFFSAFAMWLAQGLSIVGYRFRQAEPRGLCDRVDGG